MKKEEKERLIAKLFSTNENEILEAIKLIRKIGDSTFLKAIFQLLNTTKSEKVSSSISNMLNELKDAKTVPVITDAITDKDYKNIIKALLVSCWMSGLDYRNHLNIFADIFLEEDFLTAFEAFTVIENSEIPKDSEQIISIINKLKNSSGKIHIDKKDLLTELIIIFQNYQSNIKTI